MNVSESIEIAKPKELVWTAITDIDNCEQFISAIERIEVLERPVSGLVGLKWRETRIMFGKEATEVMWITDSQPREFYNTQAESHGSIYKTTLLLEGKGDITTLTMTFRGEAQTFLAKILSACMGRFIRPSMEKALRQDLEDIKRYVEGA